MNEGNRQKAMNLIGLAMRAGKIRVHIMKFLALNYFPKLKSRR